MKTTISILMILTLVLTFFPLIRVFIGPSRVDRILGLDIIMTASLGLCCLLSIYFEAAYFLDVGMVIGLVGFVGSLAFAKFMKNRKESA